MILVASGSLVSWALALRFGLSDVICVGVSAVMSRLKEDLLPKAVSLAFFQGRGRRGVR